MPNQVTLFANGIGDFQLVYPVSKEGCEITIPVRKDYLGDGINLSVFGATSQDEIEVIDPARFVASNANQSTLKLNAEDVFRSLFTALRGARVKINLKNDKIIEGQILGVDKDEQDRGTYKFQTHTINIFTNPWLQRVSLEDISGYNFTQPEVKREVEKAMEAAYEQIRPQSSIITMKLRSRKDLCNAVVCYTVPVAIWNMEYQIRHMGEVYRLTGNAIIHNNTDAEWKDVNLRCVTGIPYTGDLKEIAEQRVPTRNRININPGKAAGGTEVAGGFPESVSRRSFAPAALESETLAKFTPPASSAHYGVDSDPRKQAITPGADAIEVGDFAVLRPRGTITVPANASAVVEVIGTDLKECKSVLFYNYNQDESRLGRPQMALEFVNCLPHSLGRGPCNVYDGDLFQGTAVFPGAKSKEKRFLLHGQDTAVEVRREGAQVEQRYSSISIKKGVLITTLQRRTSITYRVRSLKDVVAELIVDHERVIQKSETVIDSETPVLETTATGCRYSIKVPSRGQTELKLIETFVERSEVEFTSLGVGGGVRWLRTNLISTEHPSVKDLRGLKQCLDLQTKLEDQDRKIQEANTSLQALTDHQKDIRANLAAVQGASGQMNDWANQLTRNDAEIQKYRTVTIPSLRNDKEKLEEQLRDALNVLTLSWRG